MVIVVDEPVYRHSYVEKDRCVRNSTGQDVPGVDTLQGFEMPKDEFERIFLETQLSFDAAKPRRQNTAPPPTTRPSPSHAPSKRRGALGRRVRQEAVRGEEQWRLSATEAAAYADACRRSGARMQRGEAPNYELAGECYERAVRTRARHGLYCTLPNADAHAEYARNWARRGQLQHAEYHLRTAADIHRLLGAVTRRRYADVLLYTAVVVDRQARLVEAETFYRGALAAYEAAAATGDQRPDDNPRVAADSLAHNLRAQGRADEVDAVMQAFLDRHAPLLTPTRQLVVTPPSSATNVMSDLTSSVGSHITPPSPPLCASEYNSSLPPLNLTRRCSPPSSYTFSGT